MAQMNRDQLESIGFLPVSPVQDNEVKDRAYVLISSSKRRLFKKAHDRKKERKKKNR
jgi:hypothetical protein